MVGDHIVIVTMWHLTRIVSTLILSQSSRTNQPPDRSRESSRLYSRPAGNRADSRGGLSRPGGQTTLPGTSAGLGSPGSSRLAVPLRYLGLHVVGYQAGASRSPAAGLCRTEVC